MMYYPEKMKKGDLIGVTATSTGIYTEREQKRLDTAYQQFEGRGFRIRETANVRTNAKLVSSSARDRADQFMDLWKDDEVVMDAQVYGGEFLMEILPLLEEETCAAQIAARAETPKWVTGFSDSSLLNYYLTTKYNFATFTTDNILYFGTKELHPSHLKQLELFENAEQGYVFCQDSFDLYQAEEFEDDRYYEHLNVTEPVVYKHLYGKKEDGFGGRVIGGCIDVLRHLMGTPYDYTKKFCSQFPAGMLWYLDNCEQTMPALYRTLWQMRYAGWFDNANGILVGRTYSGGPFDDYEFTDVLHDVFDDLKVPVVYDVDLGHVPAQWTFINGAEGLFTFKEGKGRLVQEMKP